VNKAAMGLVIFLGISLVSCVSVPDADGNNQTLVIGEFSVQGTGYGGNYSSWNGKVTNGITITIQNTSTSETHKMSSGIDGLFFSVKIPSGSYRITRLVSPNPGGQNMVSEQINPTSRIFTVKCRIVNNLGKINEIKTASNSNSGNYAIRIELDQGYEEVRNDFQRRNSGSNWHQKQWEPAW